MRILKAFFILLIIPALLYSCTMKQGPPFPAHPSLNTQSAFPQRFYGQYQFTPLARLYASDMKGELKITENKNLKHSAFFEMNISGKLHNGSFRRRHYTGSAVFAGKVLELQGDRCYEQGRRSERERLSNLSGWTCDHLIFAFTESSSENKQIILKKADNYKRSANTDWMQIERLVMVPPSAADRKKAAGGL